MSGSNFHLMKFLVDERIESRFQEAEAYRLAESTRRNSLARLARWFGRSTIAILTGPVHLVRRWFGSRGNSLVFQDKNVS